MVHRPSQRGTRKKHVAWLRPLGFLATIRGAPAFRSSVPVEVLASTKNTVKSMKTNEGGKMAAEGPFRCFRGTGMDKGLWKLFNSPQMDGESTEEESDDAYFSGGPNSYKQPNAIQVEVFIVLLINL